MEGARRTRADCTVRALATAAGIPYADAEAIALAAGRGLGRRFKSETLIAHAKRRGYIFRKVKGKPRTVARFAKEHPAGRFYTHKSGHAFAMIDGVRSDSFPGRTGCRITGAWEYLGYAPRCQPAPRVTAPKPAVDPRAVKYERTVAAIARWESKAKRATNALRKLNRSKAAQLRHMK